jgi:hypothetical protein
VAGTSKEDKDSTQIHMDTLGKIQIKVLIAILTEINLDLIMEMEGRASMEGRVSIKEVSIKEVSIKAKDIIHHLIKIMDLIILAKAMGIMVMAIAIATDTIKDSTLDPIKDLMVDRYIIHLV